MSQISLAEGGFEVRAKRTRKREFLMEMGRVVPWAELVRLITPVAPEGRTGRPPFPVEMMLRIHLLQQFYGYSDLAMEEALHDVALYREFVGLDVGMTRLPDESTILRFRHLLEEHNLGSKIFERVNARLKACGLTLKEGSVVDATLLAAPSSTKNSTGQRDPEMRQTRKGDNCHFGMKAHIGVDAESGLVHTVVGTAANVNDVTQAHKLLHGEEKVGFGDAGSRGVEKREEVKEQHPDVKWHIAMMPGKRRLLDESKPADALAEKIEQLKASVRAKVEHPFRVLKCQFGHRKVRYRGLFKNTHQLLVLFAMSNLWMVRKRMLQMLV